jgi:Tfp pilus assembly protein PilF
VPPRIESKLSDLPTIEKQDEALKTALASLGKEASPSTYCQVASEYLRLRIFDAAYDHYRSALKIDPRYAVAFDGLARLWRDAGFPDMSVTEAARAIYYAPKWAEPHNTLGTVLYALGNPAEAQREFQTALSLDPEAGYILNNLCYVSFVTGDLTQALQQCGEAVRLSPELAVARVNLAAVTAAAGK